MKTVKEHRGKMAESTEKKIAVTELVLQIGKKELRLTPEEAEKLHGALDELFGKWWWYGGNYGTSITWSCNSGTVSGSF